MPDKQGRPFVYLGGPDVFYPDALARGAKLKEVLAVRGMAGLFPLDAQVNSDAKPGSAAHALAIAEACETQIREADLGLFNIEPWRGPEADDGTAYELGFMAAIRKPVILYTTDMRPFAERIVTDIYRSEVYRDGAVLRAKRDDMLIEEFEGFADNLMLINAGTRSARLALGGAADPAAIVHFSFEAAADFAMALWQKVSCIPAK